MSTLSALHLNRQAREGRKENPLRIFAFFAVFAVRFFVMPEGLYA